MPENSAWGATAAERAALDPVLHDALGTSAPSLAGPVRRIVSGGGRLRPSLVIAAAGQRGRRVYPSAVLAGAASIELLHCATLVHDDLIDGARSRHGHPTINVRQGLGPAVLGGDILIAASFTLAERAGAGALLAGTLARLCAGQALEDARRFDTDTTEADALAVAAGKTGSLLAAACRLGARLAGLDPAVALALEEFGTAFGTSLQLLDDILDVTSTPERLGKPVAADFPAGAMTLPAVLAVAASTELRALVRPGLTPAECERAVTLLRDPEVVGGAVRQAAREADRAEAILTEAILTEATGSPPGGGDGLADLARWPRRYLQAQLTAGMDPRYRPMGTAARAELGSRA